jgi:hypothetical protein
MRPGRGSRHRVAGAGRQNGRFLIAATDAAPTGGRPGSKTDAAYTPRALPDPARAFVARSRAPCGGCLTRHQFGLRVFRPDPGHEPAPHLRRQRVQSFDCRADLAEVAHDLRLLKQPDFRPLRRFLGLVRASGGSSSRRSRSSGEPRGARSSLSNLSRSSPPRVQSDV